MVVAGAEQRLCACYKEQQEFHKVLDLKDAGLVVYCHSLCREGVIQGGVVGSAITTSQDVCVILHNTKDVKVTPAEIKPALEKNDISCPRCRKLFEHAQKLLQNVKSVDKKNALGVCDHCLKKAQSKKPCDLCAETVKKFLSSRDEKKEEMKRYLKLWLSKMRHIVKDAVTEKTKKTKPRAHSELQIDRLCQSSPKVIRQPEVKQMFHSELHKSDSNLYADVLDLEENEQKLRKAVIFNEDAEPFAVTPYEKGVVDTYRQGTSLVESDITFDGSANNLQDSITRSKRPSQKQIIHEIPKIAPWEQEDQEKNDDSSIVKEVTIKLQRDPRTIGMSPHDSSGISDKGSSSIYVKVTPRKRHMPTPESDSEKYNMSRLTDHRELGEPKRKKKMESTTDIKGGKRKHVEAGELEHPYSEQYKHEKDEFSKMSKKTHDTEGLPKTLKRLEGGHLTDDEVKLQHKIPKLSHDTEKPGKALAIKSSIRSKKPKFEKDTVENILQKQFSYFFPKSMEKEAKKPPKIGAPSSQLIRTTHEKIRQQAEEEKKRQEEERQRKLEEKEKKRIEKEEKKRLAEEKKKEAQEQKKHAEVEKRLADEERRKRAAEEELAKKAMIEEEKKKSEDRDRKESLKKDLVSKFDQKDAKGKAVKDQDKDLKTQPVLKAKAATKDRIEETEKKKKDKSKLEPTSAKDKVEETDKTKKDLKAKPEPKGKPDRKDVEEMDKTQKDKSKPETKAKPATKDKVEETEKAKKDKTKPEPTVKPGPKDKETEKVKIESKVKPESKGKPDLKDKDEVLQKAKKEGKVKSEGKLKPERVDETESAKRDKAKTDLKERVEETESAKRDKAKAEQKAKNDLKQRVEETESAKRDKAKAEQKAKADLKERVEETESAKRDKAKAEQKAKADLKERVEETESAKRDKAKAEQKSKADIKEKVEETESAKRDKAKAEQKAKADLKAESESAKTDLKTKSEAKVKPEAKDAVDKESEKTQKELKTKLDQKDKTDKDVSEKDSKSKSDIKDKDVVKLQKEKEKKDRDEQAKKDREEKEKTKQYEKLQKEKDAVSKKKQDSKAESEPSDKIAKEPKDKALDFKGMKVDKGELSEPAVSVPKDIPAKGPDMSKVKEGPLKKEDKAKEKPTKAQDKSSKLSEELKEKSKEKEKALDFKGMKVDKGELSEPAVSVPKDIPAKAPDMPKVKDGPSKKEDKAKEKPSKVQDKTSKVSEELKEDKKGSTKKPKEDTGEAEFRRLQAERLKEKELLSKRLKQEEAEAQKARDMAEKKAKADAENALRATMQIREAKATPKPEPPRPPPPPPKIEPKRVEEPAVEVKLNQVKVKNSSVDDLILRLVQIRQTNVDLKTREKPYNIDPAIIKAHKCHHEQGSKNASSCDLCRNSELEIDVESFENQANINSDMEIIIGEKIFKYKAPFFEKSVKKEIVPIFFQSMYEVGPVPITPETVTPIPEIPEPTTKLSKDAKGVEPEPGKGIIRYALSDRTFIDKGWTMLPTEKVVRKMNVYRMRPAHPEFDWFEHNKNKRLMTYDTGERLAEFDDNGRGRWYYRNGRLALDYYDAEETNAQQRFVIYSSGEPDERGRSHPITILATFDYLGNGIVFDHAGKIRLKYNQTEGVVLDRGIGPVSHWKWHTLNDPPVLQQVMIDTQMAHKDPQIIKLGTAADNKVRPDNEEMLAIEFDNFIKEKSKKLSQKFKPFQIKMKALKINEHFSLKVLDQATVYLIFRDGSTNLKLNIGMILDHQEIVDTDTAEVGEVSNNLERFPARTDSLAGLQRSVAYAQRYERTRTERERRLRPAEPCESADQLTAAASPPLRLPLRTVPTGSTSSAANCRCRKPTNNLYYNTRLL